MRTAPEGADRMGSGLQPIHDVKQRRAAPQGVHEYLISAADRVSSNPARNSEELVELDGIEPTTSCLQSRRSPN
jgi:hypothetical protein